MWVYDILHNPPAPPAKAQLREKHPWQHRRSSSGALSAIPGQLSWEEQASLLRIATNSFKSNVDFWICLTLTLSGR